MKDLDLKNLINKIDKDEICKTVSFNIKKGPARPGIEPQIPHGQLIIPRQYRNKAPKLP